MKKAGLKVAEVAEAVKSADVVMILLPDEQIAAVYVNDVEPNIKKGASLAFAHGFNVHYNQVVPREDLDVGWSRRKRRATPCVPPTQGGGCRPRRRASEQEQEGARPRAVPTLPANGGGKAGIIETNFREETETDSSANRLFFVAAQLSWSRWASRRWWKLATRPKWRTSSACTS